MALEDPFFVVKDEVLKTIETANTLYQRWRELANDSTHLFREEYDWTTNELRNCLRSIEWDLEDLEETILIVEKKPRRFKIDGTELNNRRLFVDKTRASVKEMRDHLTNARSKNTSRDDRSLCLRPIFPNGDILPDKPQNKYSLLVDEAEGVEERLIENGQLTITPSPDDSADALRSAVPACRIGGTDYSEQSVRMLDDTVHVADPSGEHRLSTYRKLLKLLQPGRTGWKHWLAITVLLVVILIVIVLFLVV